MVIGQWTYKLAGNIQKAIDGYKIIEKHFSNHGAIGSALVSSHGTDTGTFSTMIGYENYEQFGLIDDKISQDENFNNEMNPYFEITSWEKMNFAEPMMHKMEPDPGVKNCFASWTFTHKNIDMKIQQEWWPNAIKTHGFEPDSHLKLLTNKGYNIFEIDGANNKINLVTSDDLLKKYPNSKLEDINIFCKKGSLQDYDNL